jgi:DNA-binding transcriptional LysR family regulator
MTDIKILDAQLPVRLEWLRSFVAIVDRGSFSNAARHLKRSQPAVSTHIKELETNLETRLFEHVKGKMRLTRSGEAAVPEARRVLDSIRNLTSAVAESEESVKGMLNLGASTTPGNYLLPPLMGRFEGAYPKARTTLSIGNSATILERLSSNEVEIGFVGVKPSGEEFVSKPLCDDEIVVFASASHPLARKRKIAPKDLSGERFILRESDSATRRLGDSWFLRHDLRPPVMVLDSPETVKHAAAAGLGIGILSRYAIQWEIEEGKLVPLSVAGFPIKRAIFEVHLRNRHRTRTMNAFLELLEGSRPPRLSNAS